MFQWKKLAAWESTIARVDSEWVTMTTMAMVRPMAASYEIICADARIDPRSGYFEPEDQPASIVP